MVSKFFLKIKSCNAGFTLVEIIVVIFIIVLFATILISDFPKIQRQFALSSATYKLAQDIRRAQDLALSGVAINDANGNAIKVKGYGIYIDLYSSVTKRYVIYADVDGDQKYNENHSYPLCNQQISPASDCVVEIVDLNNENPSLYIEQILNMGNYTSDSINFSPPGPITNIEHISQWYSYIGIVLTNDSARRIVWVYASGLIDL